MNSERKPTALDKAVNLAAELVCTADTQEARAEVRVLREYVRCHEALSRYWNDVSKERQKVLRAAVLQAREQYREWRAEQEK